MVFDTFKYHFRETGWRIKKLLRYVLAHIGRRASPPVAGANDAAGIGYSYSRLAPARDQLLLRDFAPDSMLRVGTTEVLGTLPSYRCSLPPQRWNRHATGR